LASIKDQVNTLVGSRPLAILKGAGKLVSRPDPPPPLQVSFDAAAPATVPACPHGELGRVPAPRPRVISASKRTDIPAFYLHWFRERCEQGWVDVPNPMFRRASDPLQRLSHVSLQPDHVLAIVWWSKNYAVYERLHPAFARYPVQYFQFTINPRRADLAWLEPDVPPLEEALRQVRFLAGLHAPEMVAWRYDPLVFWQRDGRAECSWDAEFFEAMCRALAHTGIRQAFTSVADRYPKFERRIRRFMPRVALRDPQPEELDTIATHMRQVAAHYGLRLVACTESSLTARGLRRGACIDGALLGGACGRRVSTAPATDMKMKGREECGCTLHTDVGDYVAQECGYSCIYCYANPNHRRFRDRAQQL